MIKNNRKSGFTLVELMVFFVFISLVLAASAPIITKRVKHVPDKIQHGKFICDNGGRRQAYYNASQLISTQNVSKCTFKAPKKNSLFKIELVGGGAGGYDYTEWEEKTDQPSSGGFSVSPDVGPYGFNGHKIKPSAQQLIETFGNTSFRKIAHSDYAENGQDVEAYFIGIESPYIYYPTSKCFTEGVVYDNSILYCELDSSYDVINASEVEKAEEYFKDKYIAKEPYTTSDYYGNHLCGYSITPWTDGTPKTDPETGEILKDEAGNIIYEYEPTYKVRTSHVKKGKYVPKVNEDNLPLCSVWARIANNISDRIMAESRCNTADECWNIATAERAAKYNSWVAAELPEGELRSFTSSSENKITGNGGTKGKPIYLYVDGKIDFCDYAQNPEGCGGTCGGLLDRAESCIPMDYSSIKSYFSRMFQEYYRSGRSSAPGSCDGFPGYYELKNYDDTNWESKLSSKSGNAQGRHGYDVMHYGAIMGYGKCATNAENATGGEGGIIGTDGDSIWLYYKDKSPVSKGKDASGVVGEIGGPYPVKSTMSAVSDQFPSMIINQALNDRYYWVGTDGGAGEYKSYYVSNLDDDCVFDVGNGGGSVGEGVTSAELARLQEYQKTSISCNNGTLHLSADGGSYSTYVHQCVYYGYERIDDYAEGPRDKSYNYCSGGSGGSSNYPSQDVFTKYNISQSWGHGGYGSKIRDYCTRIFGWYEQSLNDGTRKQHYNIEKVPCAENEDSRVYEYWAGSGYSGAIIISW